MKTTCPSCGLEFHVPHPHLTEEGFVPIRFHRRKKGVFYIRREDLDESIAHTLLDAQSQVEHLRRKLGSSGRISQGDSK